MTYLPGFGSDAGCLLADTLDKLPGAYSQELYQQKVESVYQHVYEGYYGDGSVYGRALT